MVVVAQLVRAPDCGSGGRRFETDLPPQKLQGIAEMQSLFLCSIQLFVIKNLHYVTSGLTL